MDLIKVSDLPINPQKHETFPPWTFVIHGIIGGSWLATFQRSAVDSYVKKVSTLKLGQKLS